MRTRIWPELRSKYKRIYIADWNHADGGTQNPTGRILYIQNRGRYNENEIGVNQSWGEFMENPSADDPSSFGMGHNDGDVAGKNATERVFQKHLPKLKLKKKLKFVFLVSKSVVHLNLQKFDLPLNFAEHDFLESEDCFAGSLTALSVEVCNFDTHFPSVVAPPVALYLRVRVCIANVAPALRDRMHGVLMTLKIVLMDVLVRDRSENLMKRKEKYFLKINQ